MVHIKNCSIRLAHCLVALEFPPGPARLAAHSWTLTGKKGVAFPGPSRVA